MKTYLDFRCPNRPYEDDPSRECRRELGGPDLDTLQDVLSRGAYRDIRYCASCRVMWRVTISGVDAPIAYEMVPEGQRIDLKRDTELFDLVIIDGRRTRRVARHGVLPERSGQPTQPA